MKEEPQIEEIEEENNNIIFNGSAQAAQYNRVKHSEV